LYWRRGIDEARRAAGENFEVALGDIDNPAEFSLPELASILEYASSCVFALANVDKVKSKPWWWTYPRRDRLSQNRMVIRKFAIQAEEFTKQLQALQGYTQKAIQNKDTELGAYREQAEEFSRQVRALQDQFASTQLAIDHKDGELIAYRDQAQEFSHQVRALQDQLASTQTTILQRDGELDTLKQQLGERDSTIHTMQNSLSWHLTKPVRSLARLLDSFLK
jgi:hypothetical protein